MTVFRLYVFLLSSAPPIWRRIELFGESTLAQLHTVLQEAMGWQNHHLHEFDVGGQRYGLADTDYDPREAVLEDCTVKLSTALPNRGRSLLYTYDFGDRWEHLVVLEDVLLLEPHLSYPRVIDGARDCPPEDSGGMRAWSKRAAASKRGM